MNMPRFNAEASMYRTSNTYQAVYGTLVGSVSAVVMSQQFGFLCQVGCLLSGCIPFCQARRRATGGDFATCATLCALSPSATCALICSEGGGVTPPPSGPPVCSVEDCPPVGTLRCCGGFRCVNGRCVPPPGGSPF
jgi:hypothetical protein